MNKRKLLPCGWHELGAVEHWLGDMAHEGWLLVRMNSNWAVFEQNKPQNCRYRFYPGVPCFFPCIFWAEPPEKGRDELFHEMGWEYVTMQQHEFAVFRCTNPAAPELCTDPVIESESYRRICKKLRERVIYLIAYPFFYAFLYLGMNRLMYGASGNASLSLVHIFAGLFEPLAALLLVLLISLIGAVRGFRGIRSIRRCLALGEAIDHLAPYPAKRRGIPQGIWEGLSMALVVLALIWMNVPKQPLSVLNETIPAPLLSHLEGQSFIYEKDTGSYVQLRSSTLSEQFCETRQHAGTGILWLDTTYIRSRIPQAAGLLFDDLVRTSMSDGTRNTIFGEPQPVPLPNETRFEELACFLRRRVFKDGSGETHEWLVIARRGKQVLRAQYTGEQPIERLLDELDRTLTHYEEGN